MCFSLESIDSHVKEAPGGGRVRMDQVVVTRVNTCSRQAKRSGDRREGDTHCVITPVGVQFVVHRFDNSSSEGQGQGQGQDHVRQLLGENSDLTDHHRRALERDATLTHLLASSPPGGRLGMDSDANVLITWTRSGTPSSPCFLIISGEETKTLLCFIQTDGET